ncbi:hypothetical protein P5673_011982 [Acropora cervicornis]|uniref:Uncharacterized protein n=1 Tax=Acropora cervicornis TaxID=6130 RepID=A0AAD9QNR5_ACRCE|nr:hypothetical protein P5673_011982 [Acropora cervicornis]
MSKESLLRIYPGCFKEIGALPGTYKIPTREDAVPCKEALRSVQESQRELLRKELQRMQNIVIIENVNGPTDWVSSIVIVGKPNGDIRICQDQTLNWKAHVLDVKNKANRTLGCIKRNLHSCPERVQAQAYTSLVTPVLEYDLALEMAFNNGPRPQQLHDEHEQRIQISLINISRHWFFARIFEGELLVLGELQI